MADAEAELTEYIAARLPRWRRTAYLLCGDWDRGDDIVQHTIMLLYLKWDKVRRADNVNAYTHTMLIRRFLDSRRLRWSGVRLANDLPEPAGPRGQDEVDHAARLDVRAALRRLPKGQRATLILRYFDDFSIEQTAAALGCSSGTVKSQSARGLARLRELLGPNVAPPLTTTKE